MMFTGPRAMNSYPCQTSHMPSTHYYHPHWEPAPMQAKENPTGPLMHEAWPRYYGCQVPMACPNCSSHGHCPSPYYISPHCQQFPSPSPSPHYYGGYYPPYPQPCQVGYVPPPHYNMELPRYEYDKNAQSGFHCCECLNHHCNLKEEKGIKIEEHEPDGETKKSESLVPNSANKFSYPILWIPSDYGANKENFRSADKEVDNEHGKQVLAYVTRPQCVQGKIRQEFPNVMQHQQDSQPVEQDSMRSGWFPLDMDSLRKLMESGAGTKNCGEERRSVDERSKKDVENKNQQKQFPYNIIWLPYGRQGEKEDRIASTDPVENASSISGAVPSKSDRPDFEMEKMRSEGSGGFSKTIPVKKLEECVPKPSVEAKEQKEAKQSGGNLKTIPVKQLEEFVPKPTIESKKPKGDKETKRKADEEGAQKGVQSSSPTKKSKLPPICLRVDPPKKKNGSGNCSSRSPSPPGDKKRQSCDDLKVSGKSEAVQPRKKDIEVEAKDEKPNYNKTEVLHVPQNEKKEYVSDKSTDSNLNGENSSVIAGDDREVHTKNGQGDTENKGQETRKPPKKSLSETEATLIIQSTFRGYEVRRTEPLKKLRQIAKIRDEVHEVRKRIEDLVSSGGNSTDKERAAIGETIMKLLLKLDTIQGLLPSVRDFRKCVAKELIVLQEKLDSITCQNAAPQETRTIEEQAKHYAAPQETHIVEEQAKHSCMDEGRKDVEISNESSTVDSSQVEVSEGNSESATEFSKDSIQGEGSEYNAGISDESSKDLGQDERSQTAEQVPLLNEGSYEVDINVNKTVEVAPVSTSPVNVDSESGRLDEVTVSAARSSSELGAVKTDFNASEELPAEVSKESEESPMGLESVADDAMPNSVTLGEEEAENLLTELPREVLDYDETNKENPEMETGMESTRRELPMQVIDEDDVNSETAEMTNKGAEDEEESEKDAGLIFSPEVALGDTTQEDKDVDIDLLAELPHELPELVAEELPAEGSSSDVLNHSTEVAKSIENRESKPELQATESLARVDDVPQSVDGSVDTDVLIVEQDTNEGVVPRDEGLSMSDIVSGLNEETKYTQSPRIDYSNLDSQDQGTYCGHGNDTANDQVVGAEEAKQESFGKHSESEAQQTKDEDETSELSSESQDLVAEAKNEEIDKKIIEENGRMKEMLDKLITYGKQQQELISSLSSKVEDLEKRLARKKAAKEAKRPRVKVMRSKCAKSSSDLLKERAMGVAS